jgi:hypothetical protein
MLPFPLRLSEYFLTQVNRIRLTRMERRFEMARPGVQPVLTSKERFERIDLNW